MREIFGIHERFQALRRMTTKEFRKNFTRDEKRSKLLVRIGLISRKLPDSEPVENPSHTTGYINSLCGPKPIDS